MAIAEDDIQRVRAATSLSDLVSPYTQLRRSGRSQIGLCPFHSEKSGSFSINPELGIYHCFGCQASGDAITFVREVEPGELIVIDGVPWRVDATGAASIVTPETTTPFVVLTTMESPTTARVNDGDRDGLEGDLDELVNALYEADIRSRAEAITRPSA